MTTDDLRTRAREAAEEAYRKPRWHVGTVTDRLIEAFCEGFLAHAAQQPSREDIVVKDAEVEVERVVGYNAAARREIDRLAAIVERVREALAGHELARVITLHRIECTGLGEVTCRACRESGWMSWPEFHKHVARAVRTYLLTGDENDE